MVVGASGVIFGYLGILLTRGIVERSWWNFAVVLLVGLLYGWQLLGILPTDERISWQGHLFGLLGGVVAAILFRRRRAERPARRHYRVASSPCPDRGDRPDASMGRACPAALPRLPSASARVDP